MGETALNTLLAFISLVMLIFVLGIILFIMQYRKKKVRQEQDRLKLQDEHRAELMNAQLNSQQQTMVHIGQEIHDNVGQKLTLASLYSRQISNENVSASFVAKADAIANIIDESLSELRQLSRTLTSSSTSTRDIIELLNEKANEVNLSGACQVIVESNVASIDLPPARKHILFRILQEFIQNSLKHAECRRIRIVMVKGFEDLEVIASDDGRGFNRESNSYGIGLQNMKRRAEQLPADFILESKPGKGTCLSLKLKTE
jgi:signal transduction histidine kinase